MSWKSWLAFVFLLIPDDVQQEIQAKNCYLLLLMCIVHYALFMLQSKCIWRIFCILRRTQQTGMDEIKRMQVKVESPPTGTFRVQPFFEMCLIHMIFIYISTGSTHSATWSKNSDSGIGILRVIHMIHSFTRILWPSSLLYLNC